jgi:hypothetical protein
MSDNVFEYQLAKSPTVTIEKIKHEVATVWADLKSRSSGAYDEAVKHGIDVNALPENVVQAIELRKSSAGLDPNYTDLVVTLVNSKVALDVWTYILLPWLRDKFGDKALEARRKNAGRKSPKKQAGNK